VFDDSKGVPARTRRRASPTVEEIAKRFPELEIAERIGEGGMGTVYRARQARIDRMVALKVLALDPVDDPTFAERFRREAMVLARLDHRNIVKLYDFGEREGLFYLVLEFVDGPNLRTLMKQSLLAPAQALAIVPQICEALQFAHDEGVVHRDIKPENVLLDAKGRVKIADFGLAKLVDADARDVSLTEVGQVMGTPHYMAPEQLRGSREVDHRADIYSLGVVFYEMLTGELPRGNFELPSKRVQVDVRLDEIVLKSLERTPERRYQHAVEVKTDVEGVGTGRAGPTVIGGLAIRRMRSEKHRKSGLVIHPSKPWEFFVTFLLEWPLVAVAFNSGPGWFTLAMAFVAASFWSALRAESRGATAARHLAALALLGLGLFTLFAAHIPIFGSIASGYRSGPNDPRAMESFTTELRPILESRMHLSGPLPDRNPDHVWKLDYEQLWNSPELALLAPVLLLAAGLALSAKRVRPGTRRPWGAAVQSTVMLLGPLILLEGFCAVLAATEVEGGPLVPVLEQPGRFEAPPVFTRSIEDFSQRLRIALVEQHYDIGATGVWNYGVPGNSPVAYQMQVVFADPESPFDRWHMSWHGPRRALPHAVFVVRGAPGKEDVFLDSDLGDVRPGSAAQLAWSAWLAKTYAATQ
jgi:tRNA A-37 threonylcarbamoyl transferase component Bud32